MLNHVRTLKKKTNGARTQIPLFSVEEENTPVPISVEKHPWAVGRHGLGCSG